LEGVQKRFFNDSTEGKMLSRKDDEKHNKVRIWISNCVDVRRGIVLIFTAIMAKNQSFSAMFTAKTDLRRNK